MNQLNCSTVTTFVSHCQTHTTVFFHIFLLLFLPLRLCCRISSGHKRTHTQRKRIKKTVPTTFFFFFGWVATHPVTHERRLRTDNQENFYMYCVIVNGGRVCVGSWGAPDNRQKRAGNVRFSRIKKIQKYKTTNGKWGSANSTPRDGQTFRLKIYF